MSTSRSRIRRRRGSPASGVSGALFISLFASLALLSILPAARAASGSDACRGADLERALSHLHDDVCPAVVGVQSLRITCSPVGLISEASSGKCRRLAASGIVVDNTGCVVTAARIAQPGDSITVHFSDGRVIEAKYLGVDPDLQIAVLRLQGPGPFPSLQLAALADTLPEWVAAVAYGPWSGHHPTRPSLTLAQRPSIRVTATNFAGRPSEVWQIQAPFLPGNGGGALVTVDGDWLGLIVGEMPEITTTGVRPATGLIVPADIVTIAVEEIESGRRPTEGFLGLRAVRPAAERSAGASFAGIAIEEVLLGSPAERAGLASGDVITHLDQVALADAGQLVAKVRASQPGDRLVLSIVRNGSIGRATVTLGDRRAAGMYLNMRRLKSGAEDLIQSELRALRERTRLLEQRLGQLNAERDVSADPSR